MYLAQALAIVGGVKTTGAVAECLREQGLVAKARKQFPAATAALEESVRLCEQIKSPHHLWESLYRLAQCYAAQGALAKAEPAFRRAIAVVEELKGRVAGGEGARETFLRSKIQVYEEMAELLGRLNAQEKDPAVRRRRAEEALKYVALARFQILQQSARAVTDTGNAGLDKALERVDQALLRQSQLEEEKQKAITEGNTEKAERLDKVLATNEEQLAQGYADIKAIDPDLDARLKFDPRRLGERVAGLPERAVLVVFFPGKDALHIWVYNRDGIKEWRQRRVPREEIYALVKEYRNGIQEVIEHVQRRERIGLGFGPEAEANTANAEWYRRNIAGMRGALSKLYGHLIAPIEGDIKDADPVLILPYGQLCYLPFECLVKEDAGGFSFLGQTKRLVYFTSEEHVRETLEGMEDEATTGEDVWVAFADPRGRLGSSLEEAKQIAQFFDKNEVHSKDSGTAHKDEVMQLRPDCTILHFATHGFLNGAKPSQTFLELDSPPGDGMLAQSEIWPRLKNQALAFKKHKVRLVTLSACETARAQDSPESEVLGMPDAFTLAGAPSVVASLWSVYTYTTTDLMIEFYRSITKGKMEKAASLQRAKRSLLESGKGRYAHPFFWAPFLLFGDWR